ncbi:HIT domain-containing protein [Frigidibacter oleivorans]|uniref:HIT domain-containing protein n=1 Tax=Frigidibacter oleivorans TaxID=2487129 RepID=UPI000F8EBC60|nr:HIT domain-containing protein [Frigidibacter oleivorans]
MTYDYDDTNIFARILRGEIPNKTVLETDHTLAFEDIRPQAPVHVLVIPKGRYVSYDHFAREAGAEEIVDFVRTVGEVCRITGVALDGGQGCRTISNAGAHGVQEVPHMHVHVLGGRVLGRMLEPAD